MASSSTRFPSNSTMRSSDESEQGLFPPPIPSTFSPPPPPPPAEMPQRDMNIMNRRAGADSSLYQICMNLRRRLAEVPNFGDHLAEMEEEEAENNDTLDPVSLMWNCLRRGYPLMTIYNALRPRDPLDVDSNKVKKSQMGKAATFKFLQACMEYLKIPAGECFLITDLYGEDTTGFVKVTKLVNRVLDILKMKGLLQDNGPSRNATTEAIPITLRERIIEELVKTERDYVQHLEILQSFQNEIQGSIPGDAIHDIFLNLNQLLDFQRRFLIRIEQQNSLSEPDQNWGKLFSHYRDGFKVYEPFLANQGRGNTAVIKEWKKLQRATLSPELVGMVESAAVLNSFLVKPFQRLSKYPLLLDQLEKGGEYDIERKEDVVAGLLAAQSILDRAEEAMAKEDRIEAVSELSYRVEDWKGHKIDHFGELLLYGTFTVLKGEGAKEVEREVCGIFDSLDPRSRALILAASSQLPPTIIPRNCNAAVLRAIGLWLSRTPWRRTTYELKDICEEPDHEDPHIPLLSETPGKRGKLTAFFKRTKSAGSLQTPNKTLPSTPRAQTPRSITPTRSTQSTPPMSVVRRGNSPQTPRSMTAPAYNTGAKALKVLGILHPPELAACSPADLVESPSPSRSSKLSLSQKLQQRSPKKPIIYIPHWQESIYDTMRDPMHRLHFNRVFMHTALLFSDLPSDPPSSPKRKPCVVTSPDKKGKQIDVPFVPIRTTAVENAELKQASADGTALERPVNEQYKVYLFQRILLCCKEINPNKPKNKMLSTTKPLLDKKGKPRLQLKGRIFMQNVTDVITLNRKDQGTYTLQIFWKGDPGVENFVIRFIDEASMKKWQETVQAQKKYLNEVQRGSGQTGTSATEFSYLKSQPAPENPYREAEEVEDDDLSSHTMGQGKSMFSMSRNASSNSLRSMQTTRMAPPRFAPSEQGNGMYAPPLSLNTNIPPGTGSPAEFAGNSYFSPSNESPVSTRLSSQQSMYPFPAASQTGGERYIREDNKHRTAPAIGRAPSREGPGPPNSYVVNGRTVTRPSLPVMAASQYPQQQLASTQSRSRSASTPDIHNPNAPGARRQGNGLYPPAENVPVPPIPAHIAQMRAPINRSQTGSPLDGQLPVRSATQSPALQRDRGPRQYQDQLHYDHQGQRMQVNFDPEGRDQMQGGYHDMLIQAGSDITSSASFNKGLAYPAQLKVQIYYDRIPSYLTIVVPTSIKHRSLIDRIDSKMAKLTKASIAKGTARLRYKDSDGDIVTIRSDEDVHLAIEDWGTKNEESIRAGNIPDFQLSWHEN